MKIDDANKWLTLLANFGVVAGIVFLAFEVRQNEELLSLQYELAVLDSSSLEVSRYASMRQLWLENPELHKLYIDGMSGAELDDFEQAQFNTMCAEGIWSDALMYERSVVLDRANFRDATVIGTQRSIKERPGYRECWERRRDSMRNWGYGGYIDAVEAMPVD